MRYGFYCDLDELKEYDDEASFSFMENETCGEYNETRWGCSPYTFLHGFCVDFARMLNRKYGYEIEQIHNFENKLVHSYCVAYCYGKKVYIDVRGVTDDWEEFMEEFEDELDINDKYTYCIHNNVNYNRKGRKSVMYKIAESIEEWYKYYEL